MFNLGLKLNFTLETVLFLSNLVTIINIIILSSLQSKYALYQSPWYGLASSIGAYVFSLAFIIGLVKAIVKSPIDWREREYNPNGPMNFIKINSNSVFKFFFFFKIRKIIKNNFKHE